jgi:hypothetical protein
MRARARHRSPAYGGALKLRAASNGRRLERRVINGEEIWSYPCGAHEQSGLTSQS